jgi:hypothetical protein
MRSIAGVIRVRGRPIRQRGFNNAATTTFIIDSAQAETPPHPEPSLRLGSDLSPQAGRGWTSTRSFLM